MKVPAGLLYPESSLFGEQMAVFSPRLQVALPLCMHTAGVSSSSFEDTSHIGQQPTLMTSTELKHLLKGLISKYSYNWGFGV